MTDPQDRQDSEQGLDVIVVAYGSPEDLSRCLSALQGRYGIVVVDNSSMAAVEDVASRHGARYVDPGHNLGFAAGVNVGLKKARRSADVLLLNPDAEVTSPVVEALRQELAGTPGAACAAPAQRAPGASSFDRVCWPFPSPWGAWLEALGLWRVRRDCDYLIGSVLLLRRQALEDVGEFDERFFLYAEEADWQMRAARRGWTVLYCEGLEAVHEGAGTSTNEARREALFEAAAELFIRKWYGERGWLVYRAAVVVGCVARATFLRAERRHSALRRAMLYFSGPLRSAVRSGAFPGPALFRPNMRADRKA